MLSLAWAVCESTPLYITPFDHCLFKEAVIRCTTITTLTLYVRFTGNAAFSMPQFPEFAKLCSS
jgi:hypothetical protein